jgi:hypothetical protein
MAVPLHVLRSTMISRTQEATEPATLAAVEDNFRSSAPANDYWFSSLILRA